MPMNVRIVQLGRGVFSYATEQGATVTDGLAAAGINASGLDVRVNGKPADPSQPLREGDLVTVIPLIKGGSRPLGARASRPRSQHGDPNPRGTFSARRTFLV